MPPIRTDLRMGSIPDLTIVRPRGAVFAELGFLKEINNHSMGVYLHEEGRASVWKYVLLGSSRREA